MPDPGTAIGAGVSLIGQSASNRAAKAQAAAQERAAQMGADASVLRPVGIKTGLGSTNFGYETLPSGVQRLSSAEYNLDPRLQALQGTQYGMAPELLSGAYDLYQQQQPYAQQMAAQTYGLAQQIMPTSADLTQRAQDIASQQYALMDPQRQREEQRLGAGVFGRGRAGLNISGMGQPELFALGKSRAEQDAAIAAQAQNQARTERLSDIQLGTGLFGTAAQQQLTPYQSLTAAYQPYNMALAGITGIEDIGKGLFDISTGLGGGSSAAGSALSQGFSNAANIRAQASQDRIGMLQNIGTGITNKIPSDWNPFYQGAPIYENTSAVNLMMQRDPMNIV